MLVVGSKMPTQSAFAGENTTSPLLAVVALWNFPPPLIVDEMFTQLKSLAAGSKMPMHSAAYGAKMTRPSLAVVAPENL